MGKTVVCFCEDVLLSEIEAAIDQGHRDVESLKRSTGFGTGVCQGKSCINHVARTLWHRTGRNPSLIHPFTSRPPLEPLPLGLLAAHPWDQGPSDPTSGES